MTALNSTTDPIFLPVPAEEAFLLRAFRTLIRREQTDVQAVAPGMDWDRMAQIVRVNGLGPFLHYLYEKHPLPVPEFVQWGPLRMRQLFENVRKLRIATRLFGLFGQAGMRSVGLRGLTLANYHYPEAGLRTMKDLDILVDADGHEQVVDALRPGGLEPVNRLRSQVIYLIDGIEVEVHLSLLTAKRYRAAFDRETLLRSRVRVTTPEGDFYRLPPEQELLELVAHAFVHHDLEGFVRLLDIALVMDRNDLDWESIVRWCRDARLTNMYLFTLTFADRLFGLGRDPGSRFGQQLPSWAARAFHAYSRLYFGGDTVWQYVRRQRTLFYVAEQPRTKINQFWRIFSAKTYKELRRLAARRPLAGAAR